MTVKSDMKRAVIGPGRVISYLEQGSGEPVLLLHGVGSAARSWLGQLQDPAAGCRFIAWDAPGYGDSTMLADAAPPPRDYADAVAAFVGALGLKKFHLIGHSLGSLVATCYARHYPEPIQTLTLASIAPGHAWMTEEERARLRSGRLDALDKLGARGMAEARGPGLLTADATDAMRRTVIETMAAIRPDGWRQAVRMLSQGDTRSDLAAVVPSLPVQIIFGSGDTVTPPASNQRTASARPQAPIHEIAGAGHACYVEKTAEFNRLIARFIQAHPISGSPS